jgi:hypothetical protein
MGSPQPKSQQLRQKPKPPTSSAESAATNGFVEIAKEMAALGAALGFCLLLVAVFYFYVVPWVNR